ncbi:MAG: hypothetical protein NUV82_03305 [Candidatus Komeilibacteria bacterium]|nr:hypothetical protein [Candidatus Komeilibacteria bacterium]
MTVRKFLIAIFFLTIVAWALWWLVISKLETFSAAWLSLSLFYLTFFISLAGSFTLVGYFARALAGYNEGGRERIAVAGRQALLLSLLINISLGLQSQSKLSWLSFLILIALLSVMEFFFLAKQRSY